MAVVLILAATIALLAPAAAASRNPRAAKGVDAWSFDGAGTALSRSGASWYLDWSTDHAGIPGVKGVQFVPMIWGAGSVTAAALAQAKRSGPDLLTFNEPDMSSQANMTVAQALALWPKLEATGMQLASPAVATGAATPGGWLARFMAGAVGRHYRVDFIALHWYGGDFRTADAVAELKSYLVSVYDRYHKAIWLTEYSLINFGSVEEFPTGAQQAAFVTASVKMLDSLSFLRRFAWFALPTSGSKSTGLFRRAAVPTLAGRAFEMAP